MLSSTFDANSLLNTAIPVLLRPKTWLYVFLVYVAWKLTYRLLLRPCFLSPLRKIPGPAYRNPVLGVMSTLIREPASAPERRWAKEYGPVVRYIGPVGTEILLVTDPEVLHHVLVDGWLDNPRPKYLRHILGLITGYGLLTVTGKEHKEMRKVMNPAFSIRNLTAQTEMYYDTTDVLIDVLTRQINGQEKPSEGKEILMYEWVSKATLDIICDTAFGYKTNSLVNPDNELAKSYRELLDMQSLGNFFKLIILGVTPGLPKIMSSNLAYKYRTWLSKILPSPWITLMNMMHRIKRISAEMLQEKLADTAVTADDMSTKKDIMSLLVRASVADKSGQYHMDESAMMAQVLTVLGAGHETTASGLAWTLWLLAKDPEAQSRLREEVSASLVADPHPDYRTLNQFRWLDCVVMESLRVMPPVPGTVRTSAKDQYIGGFLVPKGTLFNISIAVINTMEGVWGEDAQEFKPTRWLNLPNAYNPTYSMLSFITGPHGCIGKTMAIMEMKAILVCLIANFEFEPAYAGQVAKPEEAITMKPGDNMPLRVKLVERG